MTSTLSELTCLQLYRPGPTATAAELAEWFDAVATVHDHLATEVVGRAADRELALADAARRQARFLRSTSLER